MADFVRCLQGAKKIKTSSKIRFGILGAGGIVQRLWPQLKKASNIHFVAIASRNLSKAKAAGKKYKLDAVGGYDNLLKRADIDAVYIALPEFQHRPWAIAAAAAGKHILCEKSLGTNAKEVGSMLAAAKSGGVRIMEGLMYPWHPGFETLKKECHRLEPRRIRAHFSFLMQDKSNYRLNPSLGGGALNDIACYTLSIARRLAGREAIAVQGRLRRMANGLDLGGEIELNFGKGLIAELSFGFDRAYDEWVEVYGKRGSARLQAPFTGDGDQPLMLKRGNSLQVIKTAHKSAHLGQFESFASAILKKTNTGEFERQAASQAKAMQVLRNLPSVLVK